jgi:cellulose biosynthesis protein BcsQ
VNVIVFASRKGGSGKSTLAAHLAAHVHKTTKPCLLVDGDPLAYVSILQRQERLVAIMQNGSFHKLDRNALARRQGRTAE